MTRRKQKSCHQCRTRHLKCDGQLPCINCRRGSRECSKDDNHIFLSESNIGIVRRRRKYSLSFETDQTWMNLPTSVRFADATSSPSSEAPSSGATTPANQAGSIASQRSCSPAGFPFRSNSDYQTRLSLDPALNLSADVLQPFRDFLISSNASPFIDHESRDLLQQTSSSNQPKLGLDQAPSSKPTVLWPHKAQWPFTTYHEALLMRHYVSEIAPWWDGVDGGMHFGTTIPELAATSPALLHAVFALSARHLSVTGRADEALSLRYTDLAYQALLPGLQAKAYEGENLAAVLLLCQVQSLKPSQRVEEPSLIKLGLEIFLSAWKANLSSSFHAHLFFSVLRMHFHSSFYSGQALEEVEGDCEWMWPALSDSGESRRWACNVKLHAAQCLNYITGSNGRTWERWVSLKRFSDTWRMSKPGYFDPVFQQDPHEGDPFPARLFASPLYASAHQMSSLARLLLLNNQPKTLPPPELDIMPLSHREIELESRLILRKVMGTVLNHVDSVTVILTSTMAITHSGHLLTDLCTQEYAYNILELAQKSAPGVIPSKEFVRLRQVWGWDEEVTYQNVL